MTPRILLPVILALAAFVATGRAQTSSPMDMFQEAWRLQESKGALSKAIDLYRALVDKYPNSSVAPQALLQLASCYEKLGRPEATDVYRQIVGRYAASAAVANVARAKLAVVDQKTPAIATKKIWDGNTGGYGGVTPDGKFITTVNWDTGALAVLETASGKTRDVTRIAGPNDAWKDFAEDSRPSPDGKAVAYAWYNGARGQHELRVINVDGSQVKVIYSNEEKAWVSVWGWMPDKSAVLITTATLAPGTGAQRTRRTLTLRLLSVNGGTPRTIKGFELGQEPRNFSLSPDGRFVAYDLPAAADRPERDLFTVSVADGSVHSIVRNPADDAMVSWLPDNRGLVFSSDRSGTYGVWMLPVANGQVDGNASLLRNGIGRITSLGFSRNGDLYYESSDRADDVSIVTIDPASGKQVGSAERLEGRYLGGKTVAVWSPDGSRIAYFQMTRLGAAASTLPPGGIAPGGRAADVRIAIQTLASGEVRLLTPTLRNFNAPVWSADGKRLIVSGGDGQGRQGLFEIDAETGVASAIVQRSGNTEPRRLKPATGDASILFFHKVPPAANVVTSDDGGIASRDLRTGTEQMVVPGRLTWFALSPDRRWFAKTTTPDAGMSNHALTVLPVSGGEPRRLAAEVATWKFRGLVAWTPDSRLVYVVRTDTQNEEVYQVPVDGGAPRRTGITWQGTGGRISPHPDGRRLAISTEGVKSETWMMQGIKR